MQTAKKQDVYYILVKLERLRIRQYHHHRRHGCLTLVMEELQYINDTQHEYIHLLTIILISDKK